MHPDLHCGKWQWPKCDIGWVPNSKKNLIAMASNLLAMLSNLRAIAPPKSDGYIPYPVQPGLTSLRLCSRCIGYSSLTWTHHLHLCSIYILLFHLLPATAIVKLLWSCSTYYYVSGFIVWQLESKQRIARVPLRFHSLYRVYIETDW